MDRAGSCSRRTNPSPNRPVQAEAAERQPFASHYRSTRGHQGGRDRNLAGRRKGGPNCRTKKLRRHLACLDLRTAFLGGKEDPAVVEKSRPAGGKETLVGGKETLVGGMETPAVNHTGVESIVRLVAESRVSPVAAEDKAAEDTIVAHSQAEEPHT